MWANAVLGIYKTAPAKLRYVYFCFAGKQAGCRKAPHSDDVKTHLHKRRKNNGIALGDGSNPKVTWRGHAKCNISVLVNTVSRSALLAFFVIKFELNEDPNTLAVGMYSILRIY